MQTFFLDPWQNQGFGMTSRVTQGEKKSDMQNTEVN